jgi:long-subunit acyl-CoA synthetase (AMP-forming)
MSTTKHVRSYVSAPGPPVPYASIPEVFQSTAALHADRVALRTRGNEIQWTWGEYASRVRSVAAGLAALGVGRESTVALMLTNRPEFHVLDTAVLHLGAVPWSIYNTFSADQIFHLLRNADTRVAITEQALLARLEPAAREAGVEYLVVVDGDAGAGGLVSLDDVVERGDPSFDFGGAWRAIEPDALATIIYTSGTTGPPKGVQLTHANVLAVMLSYQVIWAWPDGAQILSWLPMAHVAERMVSHWEPMLVGATVTCCADGRQVTDYLREVRPHYFFGVPRMWEKLKASVELQLDSCDPEALQATTDALEAGRRRVHSRTPVPDEQDRILEELRRSVGLDRAVLAAVGAAPCAFEVIEFFNALGLPLGEVYAQSEGTAAATQNPADAIRVGTVGLPMPGVEIQIAEDGEVLVRGPGVMLGYRSEPEATAAAVDAEGWLHSGDIGSLDNDGYLTIVDRKKEIIINASGKNMSPANIEAALKTSSSLIDQAVTIGDRRPFNVALLTLQPEPAQQFAREHDLAETSVAALARMQVVIDEIARGVARANERLARVEQIKRFKVLPLEWQPGGDELTPTQKLKRKSIHDKYESEIEALYAHAYDEQSVS